MGTPDTSYVVLPREALLGSRLEKVKPWTDSEPDDWVALPAAWNSAEHRWEVALDEVFRPSDVAQRDGWRTLTKEDMPSGLYPVRMNIRRQRWRTPEGKAVLSQIPAYFSVQEESSTGKRGRPPGSSTTPALDAFRQIARVVLPSSASLIQRRLALPRLAPTSNQEPKAWLTRRPLTLPEHLTIDEVWIQQTVAGRVQRDYWTVVSDDSPQVSPVGQKVLGLCKTRDVDKIQPMLREVMSWYPHPLGSSYVSVDMWHSFRAAMEEVSPLTEILFDRFHLGRHIKRAMDAVWHDCTAELSSAQAQALKRCTARPCTCGLHSVCQRWQHARQVNEHLKELWQLSSIGEAERFLATWDRLSKTRWWQDFSKVRHLLNGWQASIFSAAFLRSKGGKARGTAVAEHVNRELRRVIRQHHLTPLDRSLDQLFDVLHMQRPETQSIKAVPVATHLVCPTCGATGSDVRPSPEARAIQVRHLPHGLDRVTLTLPSQVDCTRCGSPQVQPSVSSALTAWFEDPAQLALSQAELVRLTGLSPRDVGQRVQASLESSPAPSSEPLERVIVYSEVWTSSRVWLVLTSPPGGVMEIVHVPIRTDDQAASGLHARVASHARDLIEPYQQQQPPFRLHLTIQTGELAHELRPWIQAGRVTLKEYILRSLVIKFRKQALRVVKDSHRNHATSIKPHKTNLLDDIFLLPSGQLFPEPDFYLTDLIWELNKMEHAIATGNSYQISRLLDQRPSRRHRRDAHTTGAQIRASMWATWGLWRPAIVATLIQPTVNTGYEPLLVERIWEHLQTSPALHPERQRRRLLLVLAEERTAR